MELQTVRVEDSVGKVLSHDISRIVKGEFKGTLFRKGHVISEADIPEFLKLGKENIYVMKLEPWDVHENDAGIRIGKAAAGSGITNSLPSESRVNFFAEIDGLLKINVPALDSINDVPDVILSTLHNNTSVNKGDMVAGTKVIPLVVPESTVSIVENICSEAGWVIKVIPFKPFKVGVVITGNEVYKKRIRDEFGPVISEKLKQYGSSVIRIAYVPDDASGISGEINKMIEEGAGIVMVTGGMSVDPDDVTPKAIRQSGAIIEKYGAPVLPGAMFMLGYHSNSIPVLGIPACGMFFKVTVLDLILPRILAGERIMRRDIVSMAHGGLCRACETCRYPNCSFGKSS